jgi:hypothetical protein
MTEVVRAALARIDDDLVHVLVEVGPVAECGIAAPAGRDVAELLAELIGNAVALCSPVARVRVSGQAVADRYVLEVQDCGVGASSDGAARPYGPLVESVPRRMFALFERMACSHGVSVRLCRSAHGGVNALVLLPQRLLALTTVDPPAAGARRPEGARQLARRVPMASMRAELRGSPPEPAPAPPAPPRSPEEVRSLLASYHGGLQRGRVEAGADHAGPVARLRDLVAPAAGTPA